MRFPNKNLIIIFSLILVLLISSGYSVNFYSNSKNIFNSNIVYVNNLKNPYTILVHFENKVSSNLKYNIQIIYKKRKLVILEKSFKCSNSCYKKFNISKIFFDKYFILIGTKYKGKYYVKQLNFSIKKRNDNNKLFLMPTYYLNKKLNKLNIFGKLSLKHSSNVTLSVNYLNNSNLFNFKKRIYCNNFCSFNITFKKNIIQGTYILRVYLPKDALYKNFKIKLINKTFNNNLNISNNLSKSIQIILNKLINNKNKIKTKINSSRILVKDVFGDIKNISLKQLKNLSNLPINSISLNGNFKKGYIINNKNQNINNFNKSIIKFKPKIIEVNNLDNLSEKNISTITVKKKGFIALSFSYLSTNSNTNPVVYNNTKIYISNNNKYLSNISILKKNQKNRRIIPGLYKYKKVIRYLDGSETIQTKYFAYGLISINTLKPIYHINENVKLLLVVLDKNGFLVNNASIILNITNPSGISEILTTKNLGILPTSKKGVYEVHIKSRQLGQYKLNAKVELTSMIVDINSFFNVVKYYPFDIIRNVPSTIDPWKGPFRNNFSITPLFNYLKNYSLMEKFSSDFTNITGNFNSIQTINKTTYLIWNNLNGIENKLYYKAQVPKISPYLYYLGKALIIYNNNKSKFEENRSWLFAIDPAAAVGGITSPFYCGTACNGGNEPGSGTIDTCTDGNTNYEYVNNIGVTDLNGSYFGTGDTVKVCMYNNCDSNYGGDRASLGYKNGNVPWANSNVFFNTGPTYSATACVGIGQVYCKNVILNNYVGTQNFRASVVWYGYANKICGDRYGYGDHDDINITVLKRRAPYFLSWNLDNSSLIGNNLNIIRGKNITAFAKWDRPIQTAFISHNGDGIYKNYPITIQNENWTNYTLDTLNITRFNHLGQTKVDITVKGLYFNLTNTTYLKKTFNIFGLIKINQSKLNPYIMYNGTTTDISCQVTDSNVKIPYSNVKISFYNNASGLIGTSFSNSSGWANILYKENNVGKYNITCNISNNLVNYLIAGNNNFKNQILTVKANNTDITPPIISNVTINPSIFSIGGIATIKANITDNIKLIGSYLKVISPNGNSENYSMINIGGNLFEFNFSNTTQNGNYKFYIYAFDNSSNEAWSSTYTFTVTGIRTFIGIKTNKNIYKLGENITLTPYTKTSYINTTNFIENGDIGYIFYNFNSGFDGWSLGGTLNQWQNGVPSGSFTNKCYSGNCIATNLIGNYKNNANEWIESPILNLSGRTNVEINYWRMLQIQDGTNNDFAYFEGFNGATWGIYYKNSYLGGGAPYYSLVAGTSTYYTSNLNNIGNARIRFRLSSDATTTFNGWAVDSLNISFNPRKNWNKNWIYYNNSFGSNVLKISAIQISLNITSYSSIGSNTNKDNFPDLEIQVYNGTAYSTSHYCTLDSSKSYPYTCSFVIKNTLQYLNAWKTNSNRNIRIRAINLDHNDFIKWSNVIREYTTPSIIENYGQSKVTSFLLEQFKNSSGGIVKTMYNNSISLNSGQAKELSTYWNFIVPYSFPLGNYTSYVALTDKNNNVLLNNDDGTPINDSYPFKIQSMLINVINPLKNSIQLESFLTNISLDTTYFASGGWCAYNLDNSSFNISMNKKSSISFNKLVQNISDGIHNIKFYCNDSGNWIIQTPNILFNVSQAPRISFITPTDLNNSFVNRSWTYVKVSINSSSFNSSWINWNNSLNSSLTCNLISGITNNCFINKSSLINGIYSYNVCSNNSLNEVNCTSTRFLNINKTLATITIKSPLNNSKYSVLDNIWFNISLNSPSNKIDRTWFILNNNGIKYFLKNNSLYNWEYNLSLNTKTYNITFYGNDTLGNLFKSKTNYFLVIPDKNIYLKKSILHFGNNSYKINLYISNKGKWTNYFLYDFVNKNFLYYNFTRKYNTTNIITGFYNGTQLGWNLTLAYNSNLTISYYINGSFDYNLLNNYLVGFD